MAKAALLVKQARPTTTTTTEHNHTARRKRAPNEMMHAIAPTMDRHAQEMDVDFVDVNMGCPIDVVCNKGMGAGLALKPARVQGIVRSMAELLDCPLTVKMRVGYDWSKLTAHKLLPRLATWGAAAATLHGRSRQQRYSKEADWRCASYESKCMPSRTRGTRAHRVLHFLHHGAQVHLLVRGAVLGATHR